MALGARRFADAVAEALGEDDGDVSFEAEEIAHRPFLGRLRRDTFA